MSASNLVDALRNRGLYLALGESLTGGALSAKIVDVPGASSVLLGSAVAYASEVKSAWLGVSPATLEVEGAVSELVALEMARGAQSNLAKACGLEISKVIACSTTGVAGPDLQDGKAVGTVFIGLAGPGELETVFAHFFIGTRNEIRALTVDTAIQHLNDLVSKL